jgi:glycosyltransferase involved in cell wall biosynthesis
VTPLRFCFVTTFYPPYHFGGDAIGIQRFARGLVARGHHVTVIHDVDAFTTLTGSTPQVGEVEEDGVEVVPLRSGVGALSPLLTQQTGRPVVNGRRIERLLRDGRFDVVNFHNISLIGGPGVLSYGEGSVRLYMAHEHWLVCPSHVLWRHGREVCTGRECLRCVMHYRRPPQLWRYTGFLERQLDRIDAFIAMSEFSRQKHHDFGFPREMEVLPYFLPDEEPDPHSPPAPHPRPYFLFVGRLEKIKGLDDVIPLFRDSRGADLLVAGDGEYAADLRAQARGIEHVHFLGRVPVDALRSYYEHALALIVPSVCYETFGIILIEAFRHEIPVLARRLGPFPEIVDRAGGGELFETASELLQGMRRLLEDRGYRNRLAHSGRQAFEAFWSEEAVMPRYLDIVRRAAERRGQHDIVAALAPVEVV